MSAVLNLAVAPLAGWPTTLRRWAFLIVGGALITPYVLFNMLLATVVVPDDAQSPEAATLAFAVIFLAALPGVAITGLVPAVRMLSGAVARELLGGPIRHHEIGPARSWAARVRTASWCMLHLGVGGVVSLATLLALPAAAVLFAGPFLDPAPDWWGMPSGRWAAAAPLIGAGLLVGVTYLAAGTGALLARCAVPLLGPSATERLSVLARRNQLARELHDSVGHALSIVTVQAAAANRVMDTDPAFARTALAAIEQAARTALSDLDHVLGLLRDERAATAPQPTLRDLDDLLDRTRLAGVTVGMRVSGNLDEVPAAVSREAYRIVQEGLTNALRHAGRVPVTVRLAVEPQALELTMTNPSGGAGAGRRGRGLRGIAERVTVLHGQMRAGAEDGQWLLAVRIPL